MNEIIKKIAKETKQSEAQIAGLVGELSDLLGREGCTVDNPNFLQYLVRRLRKRLKIEESKTYKTFKEFFKEK